MYAEQDLLTLEKVVSTPTMKPVPTRKPAPVTVTLGQPDPKQEFVTELPPTGLSSYVGKLRRVESLIVEADKLLKEVLS